ncbi:MAG: zinc ribbon domain-containing protein [Nitrospirae bacterium]|nr:zinc ribbon domain-containing protein [Nitrospirota bacterium]
MPIYEYICGDCGRRFEITQSMNDAPLDVCPDCKGRARRVISGGSGFIMKGNSFDEPALPRCGKEQTCCGSKTPCETPECAGS